jgi:glycosyltransferase involved in cell wall biosynthesis
VPPSGYGGTERVIADLVRELHRRGHDVTVFAPAGSHVPGTLVPTVDAGLWNDGDTGDPATAFRRTIDAVLRHAGAFDVVHSHLEWHSALLAGRVEAPVVATFHGRLDLPGTADVLGWPGLHPVAISGAQAAARPATAWAATVHNGLAFASADGTADSRPRPDDLCFVGRIDPEKGILPAIEIAGRTGCRLRIAAKAPRSARERDYLEAVVRPALARAGRSAELLGELGQAERDALFRTSAATLMPGAWPEPFGLVAIESLACGTPLVARRVGALPEILRPGIDGFFGNTVRDLAVRVPLVGDLDRGDITRSVRERFSAGRMADGYEAVFRSVSGADGPGVPAAGSRESIGPRWPDRPRLEWPARRGTRQPGSATDPPRSGH